MGRKRKIKKVTKCELEEPAECANTGGKLQDSPIKSTLGDVDAPSQPLNPLDLTVSYDYSCTATSNDPIKSMEELSTMFSFTNSQHSMTTLPSALWTDSYSQPPASKKSKSSPSPKEDSAIHSLEHLVSTIGTKLDEVKTNLCLLSSTSSDEGQSNTDLDQVHELSADQDLDEIEYSDNEDCLFWVEAAQQISQLAESGEDQESETSKVFLNTEVAQPKQISSQLLLPSHPSTDQSNFTMHYSCHEIELKRLKAIHTLSQKNKFN